ncbi:phosphoglycerate dehydrogenase [Arcanobacterium haemolyticum]|nr:phosphoglycerate dehydrogenase [Arcanobacterium haemolyticum]
MTRVLLLENPYTSADEVLSKPDFEITRIPGALQGHDLIEALDGVQILGIRSKTYVSREVIEACPDLVAIGAFCIGTNQIDLDACNDHGIAVFNAPYANTRSVVELALAEAIALTRHIPEKNAALHAGLWEKSANGAHEVRGKTLGIVGYGSIGTQLSILAEALGMRVVFYDISERLAIGNAKRVRSLAELLAQSDIVSLHVDGRPSNAGFFGRTQFEQMKKGSILINLSRGSIVDIDALIDKLDDGTIAGAGIDVFPDEPDANGDPFASPLAAYRNVILTPHIGGSTLEAQESIGYFVAGKLLDYWRKGATELSVNIPNIASGPSRKALYRIAWIHRNTPGALARVNQIFADEGANIDRQILATEGEVGYMVTDVSEELPANAVEQLVSSEQNIRLRVLRREY